jgi:hypothetical protein
MGQFNYDAPNVGNAFAQGMSLGQGQQRIDMEKSERERLGVERETQAKKEAEKETRQNAMRDAEAAYNLEPSEDNFKVLNQMDPSKAANLRKMVEEGKSKEAEEYFDKLGGTFYGILSSENPEAAYKQFFDGLPAEQKRAFPDAFDPQYAELQMASSAKGIEYLQDFKTGKQKKAESDALVQERKSAAELNKYKVTVDSMNEAKGAGGQKWYDYKDNILTVLASKPEPMWSDEERQIYSKIIKNPVGEYGKDSAPKPGSPVDFSQYEGKLLKQQNGKTYRVVNGQPVEAQ